MLIEENKVQSYVKILRVKQGPAQTKEVERVVKTPEIFRLETILPIGISDDLKNKEPRVPWQASTFRDTWDQKWS